MTVAGIVFNAVFVLLVGFGLGYNLRDQNTKQADARAVAIGVMLFIILLVSMGVIIGQKIQQVKHDRKATSHESGTP